MGPDDEVQVEIAEGVKVRCLRSTINLVLARTEPAKGGATTATAEGEAPAPAEKAEEAKGLGKLFGRK
jgi:preprotein translocase subunit YajC